MSRLPLITLTIRYFTRRGYKVKRDTKEDGKPQGPPIKFDLIVSKGNEVHPVWVKDWNRTVGVNIIINMDKVSQNAGYSNPILVAEKFSEHARAYANRKSIKTITKSEMLRAIRR